MTKHSTDMTESAIHDISQISQNVSLLCAGCFKINRKDALIIEHEVSRFSIVVTKLNQSAEQMKNIDEEVKLLKQNVEKKINGPEKTRTYLQWDSNKRWPEKDTVVSTSICGSVNWTITELFTF